MYDFFYKKGKTKVFELVEIPGLFPIAFPPTLSNEDILLPRAQITRDWSILTYGWVTGKKGVLDIANFISFIKRGTHLDYF